MTVALSGTKTENAAFSLKSLPTHVLDDGWGYRDGDITECYMYRLLSLLVIGDNI